MKRNVVATVACGTLSYLFVAVPAFADTTKTPSGHEAMVEQGGKEVMPFELNRTMHVLQPTHDGGVQTVRVHDGDPQQIALVRSHLRKEATAFAHGDLAHPAKIHGMEMRASRSFVPAQRTWQSPM